MKYTLKTMKVLQKGEWMAKSDIEYLLRRAVDRADIAKALGMKTKEFNTWWLKRLGKKIEREPGNYGFMTPQEYDSFKEKGYKDVDIAKIKGVPPQTVYEWKVRHKYEIDGGMVGSRKFRHLVLTKAQYTEYKAQGYSDVEIAKLENTNRKTLRDWRLEVFSQSELEGLKIRRGRKLMTV